MVGEADGWLVGMAVGTAVVGRDVTGINEEGAVLGVEDGIEDGIEDGVEDGVVEGVTVGTTVDGGREGAAVD